MNIQKVNFQNISFGANIGYNLNCEIDKKKSNIKSSLIQIDQKLEKLHELDLSVSRIQELLPEINGQPITVDIKNITKKRKNGDKKTTQYYTIYTKDGFFKYDTKRDEDLIKHSLKYSKLITTLENLSKRLSDWS